MSIFETMTEKEVHAHIRAALETDSGRVLEEWLRIHCFMAPTPKPEPVVEAVQIPLRQGRADLFRILQFYKDPENFKERKK